MIVWNSANQLGSKWGLVVTTLLSSMMWCCNDSKTADGGQGGPGAGAAGRLDEAAGGVAATGSGGAPSQGNGQSGASESSESMASLSQLFSLGTECAAPGELGCADASPQLLLVCGASGIWDALETCGAGQVCDSRTGSTRGTCVAPDAACQAATAGVPFCADSAEVRACTREGLEVLVERCEVGCKDGWCASSTLCYELEPGDGFCRGQDAYQCEENGKESLLGTCETPCVHGECADADGPVGREFLMEPRAQDPCAGAVAELTLCVTGFDQVECGGASDGGNRYMHCGIGCDEPECLGASVDCSGLGTCPFERAMGVDGEQVVVVPTFALGDRVLLDLRLDLVDPDSRCAPGMHCGTVRVPAAAYIAASEHISSVAEVGGIHSDEACTMDDEHGAKCGRKAGAADYRICSGSEDVASVYVEVEQYDAETGLWVVPTFDKCFTY